MILGRLRRLVWHPFVFAAWPVITLYENNVGEVPVREVVTGVAFAMAVAGAVFALAMLAVRERRTAGLVASVVMITILLWGDARDALHEPTWLLPAWLLGAVVVVLLVVLARPVARELTIVASAMSLVGLGLALGPILAQVDPRPDDAAAAPDAPDGTDVTFAELDAAVGEWQGAGEPRDIYYLVFDRYGSQDSMERRWEADFGDFFDWLESRGFRETPDTKANHLRTAQSLASTFNLRYHHDLTRRYGPDTSNMLPIFGMLQHHAVGRLLRDRGYEYVHIGNWWDPTQHIAGADISWSYERWSDFELELFRSSLFEVFEHRPEGRTLVEERRRMPYEGALQQFAWIREASRRPGPTFTFAHVLLPHEPFVFDREGSYVDYDEEARRGRQRNYVEQTHFTNDQIMALVDELLDVDQGREPVIVISADEGPHPVRFKLDEENFDWARATDAELDEKMSVLNAYYLPGVEDEVLYDSISPVNTWRVLFNTYFGADLELLEDRSYVFRDENHVYDFTEVTQRLRAYDEAVSP